MTKKHTAKIAGLTLAVALLCASVPAAVLTSSAIVRAETATVETAEINDYYFVGDEIEIPATAEIKLADGQIKRVITKPRSRPTVNSFPAKRRNSSKRASISRFILVPKTERNIRLKNRSSLPKRNGA